MNCAAALDLMLEADLGELRGTVDTPLARHLGECAICRALAARILAGEGALDRALSRLGPGAEAPQAARETTTGRRRWRPVGWRALVPLAAAAGIGTVLILGRGGELPQPGAPAALARGEPAFAVEVPAGRNAMVIETGNPTIVVVWLY